MRLREELLEQVDRERKRARLTRADAINEALDLWVNRRRYGQVVGIDQDGYERKPINAHEFEPVLGAQMWPK